ncbi:hypothetical protein CPB86DRAFT_285952 [Serendipita vermifera]|nr:hypothetical protein CPB86DRAFT_285952 [Serendipita vermifera]
MLFFCGATTSTSPSHTPTTSSLTSTPTEDVTPNPSLYQDRFVGGGPRNNIYGTSRWGSGLGNVAQDASGSYTWVPSLSLQGSIPSYPFGFWPIYRGNIPNYYPDSIPFKSARFRPGGRQLLVIASTGQSSNRSYYYIISDKYTIKDPNKVLKLPVDAGGCDMYDENPIYCFDPETLAPNGTHILVPVDEQTGRRTNFTLSPESAIQYYRGSSVVLGTPGFVNAYGLNHNNNTDYWNSTHYDVIDIFTAYFTGVGSDASERYESETSFLDCLNKTIAAAVPIIDPALTGTSFGSNAKELTPGEIANIVIVRWLPSLCC